MRHRKASIKLNRTSGHREAMFRNMVTSLFKYERIRTTDAKAKELSRWADKLITLAKKGDLHSRRQVLSIVKEKKVVHQLFEEASDRYGERPGGHTRIIKIGKRAGDAAPLSVIELIGEKKEEQKKAKKKKTETVKKEEVAETKDGQEPAEKEVKPATKTKKTAEPKKKKTAAKKKAAPKKKESDKKVKKDTSGVKEDKDEGKKKSVKAKKKATPKKAKEKKKEK